MSARYVQKIRHVTSKYVMGTDVFLALVATARSPSSCILFQIHVPTTKNAKFVTSTKTVQRFAKCAMDPVLLAVVYVTKASVFLVKMVLASSVEETEVVVTTLLLLKHLRLSILVKKETASSASSALL